MATNDQFRAGKQPCDEFMPQREANVYNEWDNRHCCYRCDKLVSFCTNCYKDHHEDGYENCVAGKEEGERG